MMNERKARPKAKGTSRPMKTRKLAAGSKSVAAAPAKVKAGAQAKRSSENSASHLINERMRSLGDWRSVTLTEIRRIIREADPDIVEEVKWIKPSNPWGVPVWSHAGIICTGETYQQVVKLTFARGASLQDPQGLFNSSLEGSTRRAIDIREGETLDAEALAALIQAAIAHNLGSRATKAPGAKSPSPLKAGTKAKPAAREASPAKLLSGGNPQIAKADGDAPVQAYIAAMPGWKRDLGKRLDAIVVRNVPGLRKAVKWNSPFYGIEDQGFFLSFHVFTRYVKVTFFRGTSLRPVPPGGTGKDARWIDIQQDDLDEAQIAMWVKQAAALPGWIP